MSNDSVHDRVSRQFGPVAANYATSVGHADLGALLKLVDLLQPQATDSILDIATGAGNVALAFAPHVAKVVAFDLTQQMLEMTAQRANEQGITNLVTKLGKAESLPFDDETFDIVVVRLAPHHFADIRKAVSEMSRVVKPGGRILIVDSTCPEDKELARQVNELEKLRDPSHVRNYSPSEWTSMLADTWLIVKSITVSPYLENGRPMQFAEWTERIVTPTENIATLRHKLTNASDALKIAMHIEVDGEDIWLTIEQVTILATKDRLPNL